MSFTKKGLKVLQTREMFDNNPLVQKGKTFLDYYFPRLERKDK
jgi:hypothetical protein